ncbi:MAG TPA: hypothetical protein VGM02_04840 [Acidobacteriaceae bacterium]|jgi:hypothetical protein
MPDTPQFSTAEYTPPQIDRCSLCTTPLAHEYYRVRGQTACTGCAVAAQSGNSITSNNAAFTRALLFGIGAAIVGLAGYSAFTIATNFYIGYVALGVGYIVARAMKFGSGGIGGRRYQITAVILTYLAIALAEIPIILWQLRARIPSGHMFAVAMRLLPVGLESPILAMRSPVHGLINAVIVFVGLQIAWRGTAATQVAVEGPFRLTPAAS